MRRSLNMDSDADSRNVSKGAAEIPRREAEPILQRWIWRYSDYPSACGEIAGLKKYEDVLHSAELVQLRNTAFGDDDNRCLRALSSDLFLSHPHS
jgi:hypothetical protein